MASEIDICNLALAHLGDRANVSSINPPERSVQAEHCARFYPIARDTLLEMHPWNFARTRVEPAGLESRVSYWPYAWSTPNNCINIIAALPEGATSDDQVTSFKQESDIIYTREPLDWLLFTAKVVDTTKFSPLFSDALAFLLAGYLAGPIRKETDGRTAARMMQMVDVRIGRAKVSDANANRDRPDYTPSFVKARQ